MHSPFLYRLLQLIPCLFLLFSIDTHIQGEEKEEIKMTLSEKMKQLGKEKRGRSCTTELCQDIQNELVEKRKQLQIEYNAALQIIGQIEKNNSNINPEKNLEIALQPNIAHIQKLKEQIKALEERWENSTLEKKNLEESEDDSAGIWHQPDTTLGQLIIDYNITNAVYVMPPEIASIKIHLSSQLAIPKASWSEMLEVIMTHMGIGIKQVTPFVKQLYILRQNLSGFLTITDERTLLEVIPENSKIAFLLSPPPGNLRRAHQFIEKFSPQEQLSVQILGGHLVITGLVREIRELLKIYDFITDPKRAQEYRIIPLHKADSEEVSKIVLSMFEGDVHQKNISEMATFSAEKPINFLSITPQNDSSSGFKIIPMRYPSSSLFLMGKTEQIDKACQIIKDIEANIGDIQDKTIHWYACQHSEAEDLAKVLSQVYIKLLSAKGTATNLHQYQKNGIETPPSNKGGNERARLSSSHPHIQAMSDRAKEWSLAHPQDNLIVTPSLVSTPGSTSSPGHNALHENFIVDPKTNSIIMVVENGLLSKLKDLVTKLDVPKRMVQIDVLMFEKRVSDSSSFGLSMLKTGAKSSKKHSSSIGWNETGGSSSEGRGILQFALSRGKGSFLPSYELAYQFLLSQENIHINANPSIVTVNQTPARIAVVDQISINTGAVEYNKEHVKDSYARVEYGITIQITPTVHSKIDQEEIKEDDNSNRKFVTLATEICFDTTHPNATDRPEVTRRNIKNEVRVRDGETVILGGLRKKHSTGSQQSIPFLGDIPGIGKLFSTTALTDSSTEMFIFITPKIVPDNREETQKMRYHQLLRRPGDIPEFLQEVEKAKNIEKEMLFERSLQLLFNPISN